MMESEWKARVFEAWLMNDQQELARLRNVLDYDGIGRSLREEATQKAYEASEEFKTYLTTKCLWEEADLMRCALALAKCSPTRMIMPRMVDGKPRWGNQTDSGQNKLGPSPQRKGDRSRTYPGIAAAFAQQWGS